MCGASLVAEVGHEQEERKVVTVLFTDLVGFTSRSERLDPEDVRATLAPYYARLREQIEQRGGTVEKFIGDAVMAVFGAPVAHEDDPERAVRTALAIREAIRQLNEQDPTLELQIRTAVNTGEALVALQARASAGEGIASGDVVNTAARLQTAAPVDGILVGEATYRATSHVIEYREAAPVDAKGKSRPIPVWEVVGARSRFGIDVDQRSPSALVGRKRELGFLIDAFVRCRTDQTVQLVTLVGVPGIGKSRLVSEFFGVLDAEPEIYWWRQGRSLPYGETQSFWALGEIIKAQAGILETDTADTTERKLAEMLAEILGDDADRPWIERHVRPLAGVIVESDATSDRRDEAFSAWRRLFEALAEQHPLVLVFDDAHWADDGLLDFVDNLADWATAVPLLIVVTARPELLGRRPGWGGGKRNASTVSLAALSHEETAQLLGSLLDQMLLPAELQSEVLSRADGNPLYAEQYVRMLQERKLLVRGPTGWQLEQRGELPLPETVQGMIAARLDALSPEEKDLLQNAAVVGKVFWRASLVAIGDGSPGELEEPLHTLERKEFIRRDRRSAVAGETQYAFLHLLVRDVAYGQIPRARRAEKHRRAAEWIEALAPDRSDDRAEMLAHHYREALAFAEAAGVEAESIRGPARQALTAASERAEALHAWPAAREHAQAALALTAAGDPAAPWLQLRIAHAALFVGDLATDTVVSARDGFLAQGELVAAAEAEAVHSLVRWYRGEGAAATAAADHSLELAAGQPVSAGTAWVYAQSARRAGIGGDLDTALVAAARALDMAEQLGREDYASHALNTLGMARVDSGDENGIVDLERSVELAKHASSPLDVVAGCNNLANELWVLGRLEEATVWLAEARTTAERFGLPIALVWADAEVAYDCYVRGDYPNVVAHAERFLAEHGDQQIYQDAPQRTTLTFGLLAAGRLDEALEQSERALPQSREIGDAQLLGATLLARALALTAAGRSDEATPLLDELLASPTLMRWFHWLAPLPLFLVELDRGSDFIAACEPVALKTRWRTAGIAAAKGDLRAAADEYAAIGSRFVEGWARLLAAEQGGPGADEQLALARTYFEEIDAPVLLRRCDLLLQDSA
jgi:class 3 adenylate cyclase/tetratricopeptide (TPR) repeat protein